MERDPFISIVIPALNEEEQISRCLGKIRELDYPQDKTEVIVVDNGSSDHTTIIAQAMGANVYSLPHVSIGALRNHGFEQSSGEYIAFIDADCIPGRNWLREVVTTYRNFPDAAVVCGVLASNQESHMSWVEKLWIKHLRARYQHTVQAVMTLASFCFVIKRQKFQEVGGFNEELRTCEDSDFGYRISQTGNIIVNTNIRIVHLRNAKTLSEFFKRQLWQGRSNLQNIFSHGLKRDEVPSIIGPLCFILSLIALPIMMLAKNNSIAGIPALLLIGLPLVISCKKGGRKSIKDLGGYLIIWFVYLLARGIGLLFPRFR